LSKANGAYASAMGGSIATGAATGFGIGSFFGPIGQAIGATLGGIGGLIGGFFTGQAAKDYSLEDTQKSTEALAKAIADGAIVDTGTGYEVKDKTKLEKYKIKESDLAAYYAEVGDSTEALRDFGNQLLET
jgi:hypothetical protein